MRLWYRAFLEATNVLTLPRGMVESVRISNNPNRIGDHTAMHLAIWVGAPNLIVQDARFNVYELRSMTNQRADLYAIGLGDFSYKGQTRLAIVGDLSGKVEPPKRYRLYTWKLHINAQFEEDLELAAWMADHQITRSDEWPSLDET